MELELGDRLNLITGDNGLGKSFLLDIAWWALTRTWPQAGQQALPREDAKKASILASIVGKTGKAVDSEIPFDFKKQHWVQPQARPHMPGLVIYARVDGGFSVWDPARNYWKTEGVERPAPFLFDSNQVWSGLQDKDGNWRCNGLYRDWASWQREDNEAFQQLCTVMEALSPPGDSPLKPGPLRRISPDDSQDYPTIEMPYGTVPVVHASAAIRRILALAYLLIWARREHALAAGLRKQKPDPRIVFLVDEVEAHLHPSWQRRILPSVLTVVHKLAATGGEKPSIQVVASTHSPFVCVSAEPDFDSALDRIFDLDLDPAKSEVRVEATDFERMGTIVNWLLGRNFDMRSIYSEPGEAAIANASRLVGQDVKSRGSLKRAEYLTADAELRKHLMDRDAFWVVWRRIGEREGWLKK